MMLSLTYVTQPYEHIIPFCTFVLIYFTFALLAGFSAFMSYEGCVCWACRLSRFEVLAIFGLATTLVGIIVE